MAELRCNNCVYLKEDYCDKLKEVIPNDLARLFYGGAKIIFSETIAYPSLCGIEKEQENKTICNDLDLCFDCKSRASKCKCEKS